MEIKSYKISAVIPTGQYANIQPSLEMEGGSIEQMSKEGMSHIRDMFDRYSDQQLKKFDVSESYKLFSFNEEGVSVDFDRINHVYKHNGNVLESASDFVKKYSKDFNPKLVAQNCEKSWGISAKEIQDMWSSNADISTELGNIIHKTLEHWIKFKDSGITIMGNTEKEENPAIPKHPVLRNIIKSFDKLCGGGNYLSEVFVTDIKNGKCGQIDRLKILDNAKKVCRVQDYKVNVGAEEINSSSKLSGPFKDMPANKLSKYQIQLSYYGQMLAESGWKVDGLDVFVYEDVWKLYELDSLKL